jgi:hypothetical protein
VRPPVRAPAGAAGGMEDTAPAESADGGEGVDATVARLLRRAAAVPTAPKETLVRDGGAAQPHAAAARHHALRLRFAWADHLWLVQADARDLANLDTRQVTEVRPLLTVGQSLLISVLHSRGHHLQGLKNVLAVNRGARAPAVRLAHPSCLQHKAYC